MLHKRKKYYYQIFRFLIKNRPIEQITQPSDLYFLLYRLKNGMAHEEIFTFLLSDVTYFKGLIKSSAY